jgi:hypothetical protein
VENELLQVTVLPEKGADIYELRYKPKDIDVLWKSPWGLKTPGKGISTAADSMAAWLEHYEGGWQEIFPNGGNACTYRGAELNFHGEASMLPWAFEVLEQGRRAEVRFSTRLFRSPFSIERVVSIASGEAILTLDETIRNDSREPLDYMWGHHPAYGAPFLSQDCRIDVGARSLRADDLYLGNTNPLTPGQRYNWPMDATPADLSRVPGVQQKRDILAYFEEFENGWYGITNTDLGLGVGLVWPKEIFPFAWFWQELYSSPGYPWYQSVYVMAIEPFSSIPGQGLQNVISKTGTQKTLEPGQEIKAQLKAVIYKSSSGIKGIDPEGAVTIR